MNYKLPPSLEYYAAKNRESNSPQANFVAPDPRTVHRLRRVLAYYARQSGRQTFEYGTTSAYKKYHQPPAQKMSPVKIIALNRFDDLPLSAKLA